MDYFDFSFNKGILAAMRAAERTLERYKGAYGATEGLQKAIEDMRNRSPFWTLSVQMAEMAERQPDLIDRYIGLQPTITESLLRAMQTRERFSSAVGLKPQVFEDAVSREVPDLSAEETAFVSEAVDTHLPAVVQYILSEPEAAPEAEQQAAAALLDLYRSVAPRLTADQLARLWNSLLGIVMLLFTVLSYQTDREALDLAARQTAIAEQQLAESREDSRIMAEQLEIAEESRDLQREALELQRAQMAAEEQAAEELNSRMMRLESLISAAGNQAGEKESPKK